MRKVFKSLILILSILSSNNAIADIGYSIENLYPFKDPTTQKVGVMHLGEVVLDPNFEDLRVNQDRLLLYKENGKWGLGCLTQAITEPIWDDTHFIGGGLQKKQDVIIERNGKVGIILTETNQYITPQFDKIASMGWCGIYGLEHNGKTDIVDSDYNFIETVNQTIESIKAKDAYKKCQQWDKQTCDKKFVKTKHPSFVSTSDLYEGGIFTDYVIDKSKVSIVKKDGKKWFHQGDLYFPMIENKNIFFQNGILLSRNPDTNLVGLYDPKTEKSEEKYDSITPLDKYYYIIWKDGKAGVINRYGREILKPMVDNIRELAIDKGYQFDSPTEYYFNNFFIVINKSNPEICDIYDIRGKSILVNFKIDKKEAERNNNSTSFRSDKLIKPVKKALKNETKKDPNLSHNIWALGNEDEMDIMLFDEVYADGRFENIKGYTGTVNDWGYHSIPMSYSKIDHVLSRDPDNPTAIASDNIWEYKLFALPHIYAGDEAVVSNCIDSFEEYNTRLGVWNEIAALAQIRINEGSHDPMLKYIVDDVKKSNEHAEKYRQELNEAIAYVNKWNRITAAANAFASSLNNLAAAYGTIKGTNSSVSEQTIAGKKSMKKVKSQGDRDSAYMTGSYKADSKSYSDWETQLIKMKNGDYSYSSSEVKSIQNKMRALRERITSHGGTCNRSPLEDWNP